MYNKKNLYISINNKNNKIQKISEMKNKVMY